MTDAHWIVLIVTGLCVVSFMAGRAYEELLQFRKREGNGNG